MNPDKMHSLPWIKSLSDKQLMSTIKMHIWALCACVIFPTIFCDDLKELSLALHFYISELNLPRKILETLCKLQGAGH